MHDMLKTTPDFSFEAAAALLAEHYGLTGTLSPLASERDQNFRPAVGHAGFSGVLGSLHHESPETKNRK